MNYALSGDYRAKNWEEQYQQIVARALSNLEAGGPVLVAPRQRFRGSSWLVYKTQK